MTSTSATVNAHGGRLCRAHDTECTDRGQDVRPVRPAKVGVVPPCAAGILRLQDNMCPQRRALQAGAALISSVADSPAARVNDAETAFDVPAAINSVAMTYALTLAELGPSLAPALGIYPTRRP